MLTSFGNGAIHIFLTCSHTGKWFLTLFIWHSRQSRHSHGFFERVYIDCFRFDCRKYRSKKKWICPAAGNDCLKMMQQKLVFQHYSTCQLTQVPPIFPPEYRFFTQYTTQTLRIVKFGKCWPIWRFSKNKTERISRTSLESINHIQYNPSKYTSYNSK